MHRHDSRRFPTRGGGGGAEQSTPQEGVKAQAIDIELMYILPGRTRRTPILKDLTVQQEMNVKHAYF